MKRFLKVMGILSIALVLVVGLSYAQGKKIGLQKIAPTANDEGGAKKNPDAGDEPNQDTELLTPNLSFPVVFTTPVFMETPLAQEDELFPYQTFFEMEQALEQIPIYDDEGNIIGYTDGDPLFTTSGEPVLIFSTDENGDYILTPIAEEAYKFSYKYDGNYDTMSLFVKYWWSDCDYEFAVDPATGEPILDPVTLEKIVVPTGTLNELNYETWLLKYAPWYEQATYATAGVNIWQADYTLYEQPAVPTCEDIVKIDFVDWGNPLENINPVVGLRFPVEIALYQRLGGLEYSINDSGAIITNLDGFTMRAYKSACLEYMSSRDELFGVLNEIWGSYYATVLTTDFEAWVIGPGGVRTDIVLEPAIGPSGKMNFASAAGGWIPTVPGQHRIYFRVWDPLITLKDAIVNDDDHYCMTSGLKMEDLSWWKQQKTGIYYNDTWIDVMVDAPSGGRTK